MNKDQEHLMDSKGGSSSCCGASVYLDQGICCDCKEPCDVVEDEDDSPEKTDEELEFDRKALLGLDPLKQ